MTKKELIAAWRKKLRGRLTESRLNDDIIPAYKAIAKANPYRSDVWVMVCDKALAAGFGFDVANRRFVAGLLPLLYLRGKSRPLPE